MARSFVRLLPFEMAMLGLFELMLLFTATFAMLEAGGSSPIPDSPDLARDCLVLAGMLAVTIAGTAATIGLYRPEVCLDRGRLMVSGTIAALVAFPAILMVSGAYRVTLSGEHIVWLARLVALWLVFALLVRSLFSALAARVPVARRVLIVGTGPRAVALHRRLKARRHSMLEPATGDIALTPDTLRQARVWGIVVVGDLREDIANGALLDIKMHGVPVYSELTFQEQHLGRIELDAIDSRWMLFAEGFQNGAVSRAVKRVFDVAVSIGLTIVTLPLMAVTALLIKLDSPGPIFYRQVRTGLHGVPFTLFKFRSMTVNAEVAGKPQWAQKSDPRVTRVGGFIRASRIDELPQLINILRGEMSMIGPRPERPMFVEELAKAIPFYNSRACVKPGLTGWAQVNYPYGASVEDAREKLAYDLFYVKNRGILLDFLILLSTVRVILFREGAR